MAQDTKKIIENIKATLQNEKKKIIITCLLLGVMGKMWFKVLTKDDSTPASVTAAQQLAAQQQKKEIEYTELQFIPERHTVLDRDFFSPEILGSKGSSGQFVMAQSSDKDIELAAKMLKLQAIMAGDTPQAFIDDELLGIGEKIELARSGRIYEFVIGKITDNMVQLKCGDTSVVISIAEPGKQKD